VKVVIWTENIKDNTMKKVMKNMKDYQKKGLPVVVLTDIVSESLGLLSETFDIVIDSCQFSRLVYNRSFESD